MRRLKRFGLPKERTRYLTAIGQMAGAERYGVHSNSLINLERALVERVFTVGGELPPSPDPRFLRRKLARFSRRLQSHVPLVQTLSTNEFVESYVGRKRGMYARAAASLVDEPIDRKDAVVSSFIKDEKTNLDRKVDPCPRIIQPRTPRFNVAIGVYLKPLEKAIFRGIAGIFRGVTVLKGYNAVERGVLLRRKWDRFTNPVAVMLDASRFDQHVSRELLDWEQHTFETLLVDPLGFRHVNQLRRTNRCYARAEGSGFAYELNGVRMSGDMDTALGNCMSMCAMTWSFMDDLGIEKYEYGNDGDDGVIIMEEEHLRLVLDNFEDYFRGFGFTMKLEGVAHKFEGIEFCQCHPVWDGEQFRMVRNPDVALMKDSLTLSKQDERTVANAVGWGGLALAGTIPICGEYYRQFITSSYVPPEYLTCGRDFLAARLEPRFSTPTDETRISFYEAFGVAPDTQIAIERAIRQLDAPMYQNPMNVEILSGGDTVRWW